MTFGILCEGEYDKVPLTILVERLLKELLNCQTVEFVFRSHSTDGSLKATHLKEGIVLLRSLDSEYLAVFFDLDENPKKEATIKKIIEKVLGEPLFFQENVAFGFAKSEFEEWLLMDHSAVKNIMSLRHDKPLPLGLHKNPKENLRALIDTALSEGRLGLTDTSSSIYQKLAQESNLEELLKNHNFQRFFDRLRVIVGAHCEKLISR